MPGWTMSRAAAARLAGSTSATPCWAACAGVQGGVNDQAAVVQDGLALVWVAAQRRVLQQLVDGLLAEERGAGRGAPAGRVRA